MINSLQFLRLLALAGIVFGHVGIVFIGGGVELCSFFFILSGFLYKGNKKSYGDYVWQKCKTIFPIYWICLGLYLFLAVLRGNEEQSSIGWDIIPHLLLIQSWIPSTTNFAMQYLGLGWFLSSLLFCYVLSPILCKILKGHVCELVAVIFFFLLYKIAAKNGAYASWNSYVSPFLRCIEYSIGMCMGLLIRSKNIGAGDTIQNVLAIVSLALWIIVLRFGILGSYYWIAHLCILATFFFFDQCRVCKLFGNGLVRFISRYDMWIYLTHAGIGFHIVFHFISTDGYIAAIGSILFGVFLGYAYEKLYGLKFVKDFRQI